MLLLEQPHPFVSSQVALPGTVLQGWVVRADEAALERVSS